MARTNTLITAAQAQQHLRVVLRFLAETRGLETLTPHGKAIMDGIAEAQQLAHEVWREEEHLSPRHVRPDGLIRLV